MGKLVFPREIERGLTSLLKGGFYISKLGANKYAIYPRTYEAFQNFDRTINQLCSIGYKQVKTTKPGCAVLKLPTRKLKLEPERLSDGELLEQQLKSGCFDLFSATTEMQKRGWKHVIAISRIDETDDCKEKYAILKGMIPTLTEYGYKCYLKGNALFVSGACKQHDEAMLKAVIEAA